jgi:hypothetical protein
MAAIVGLASAYLGPTSQADDDPFVYKEDCGNDPLCIDTHLFPSPSPTTAKKKKKPRGGTAVGQPRSTGANGKPVLSDQSTSSGGNTTSGGGGGAGGANPNPNSP